MSARDEFIKRVHDNSDAAKNHEVQVRNDIQHYCSAMESLSRQVQTWMDGSGVEVQQAIIFLSDESIQILPENHISQYNIASIKMKNSDRYAELKPVDVYGGGARGWASLIVTSPRRAPSSEIFQLRLDPTGL